MTGPDRTRSGGHWGSADLPHAPAAERNKAPIWDALAPRLPSSGCLLEIGAGTGQHAVYMAARAPQLEWVATDLATALPGLSRRFALEGSSNLRPPVALDVRHGPWPRGPFAAGFAANVAHIMDWAAVESLFTGLATCLSADGVWFLYGPFKRRGAHTSPGNRAFDSSLRAAGQGMGIREVEALERLGARHHLALTEDLAMPANNRLLVFRPEPENPETQARGEEAYGDKR